MSKVLFVAVHPDDETLGCGGSILKHKALGDEIYWLIITSVRNHPLGIWSEDFARKRDETIKRVAEAYGFNKVVELELPSIMLDKIDMGSFVGKVSKALDDIKPDTIYMMNRSDVHSDHRVSFSAVYGCLKSFRRPYIHRILMFEALSETEFATPLAESAFIPNVFVDITSFLGKKLEIMNLFQNEIMEDPYPRSISSIEALARYRGARAGVKYAEAFMLIYELL